MIIDNYLILFDSGLSFISFTLSVHSGKPWLYIIH